MSSYFSSRLLRSIVRSILHHQKNFASRVFKNERFVMAKESGDKFSTCSGEVKEGCLEIGDFSVFAWSISGIETTVVVTRKSDKFSCCFDMGYSCRQNVSCDQIMISHGHMDHISAVPQHMKKRSLLGMKPASYYVPEHLVNNLTEACKQFSIISENTPVLEHPQIFPALVGDKIKLNRAHFAVPFPTVHRVRSQGYLVYRTLKKLKPEFMGLPAPEIGSSIQKGVQVHDIIDVPEIAFTGDTTFEVFTNDVYTPPPDLFKVKLLIVEATYINDDCELTDRVEQARQWGHIHLSEIYENAHLFKDVGNILLMHISDKYSVKYIYEQVFNEIPETLKGKVHVATVAKERYL